VDIVVFNALVWTTGIIPLAQFCGAGAGFALNFAYNRFLTFAHGRTKESLP
jgi:putative flippase GtrA